MPLALLFIIVPLVAKNMQLLLLKKPIFPAYNDTMLH
jgi:hypothetical protein